MKSENLVYIPNKHFSDHIIPFFISLRTHAKKNYGNSNVFVVLISHYNIIPLMHLMQNDATEIVVPEQKPNE